MNLQRGSRTALSQLGTTDTAPLTLRMRVSGPAVYDCTCFGLDGNDKLSSEDFMIFYNQPSAPAGTIRWAEAPGGADFTIRLSEIPPAVSKLAFTVSIDGPGRMSEVSSCSFELLQNGKTLTLCELSGADFRDETAVICAEIYRKPDWRLCAVMRGYNGGLGDLLRDYGGEEEEETAPGPAAAPQPSPANRDTTVPGAVVQSSSPEQTVPAGRRIDLEKKLQSAPKLVSLAKPLKIALEKRDLQNVTARVALVMDISGSMSERYANGTVQRVVNKTLPLAVQFDDDGELDFWYYGSKCKRMPNVTLNNYEGAVPGNWERLMRKLGYGNNEPVVMREVIDEFANTTLPVYILFITDGGVANKRKIMKLMEEASYKPIFWQFVGVGGSGYGVLKKLDEMTGRYVDNAGFFALDDFDSVPNDVLYERLLDEFPKWLNEVRRKGMIL